MTTEILWTEDPSGDAKTIVRALAHDALLVPLMACDAAAGIVTASAGLTTSNLSGTPPRRIRGIAELSRRAPGGDPHSSGTYRRATSTPTNISGRTALLSPFGGGIDAGIGAGSLSVRIANPGPPPAGSDVVRAVAASLALNNALTALTA